MEALDDKEYSGSLLTLLQDGEKFVKNNTKKRWKKVPDGRMEMPDIPERAALECIVNGLIHKLWKAFHKRCYAKLIVMQSQLLIDRNQGLFSYFNLA